MGNFLTSYRQDSIWDSRGVAACFLAPLAPAFAYSMFGDAYFFGALLMGSALSYCHMIVFGLPLAILLDRHRKVSLLTTVLGASVIGVLPWIVFFGLSVLRSPASMGGEAMVAMIFSFGFFGAMGFLAGISWWLIATPLWPSRLGATAQ